MDPEFTFSRKVRNVGENSPTSRQYAENSPDLSSITTHRSIHGLQDRLEFPTSKTEELLGISSDEVDDVDEE